MVESGDLRATPGDYGKWAAFITDTSDAQLEGPGCKHSDQLPPSGPAGRSKPSGRTRFDFRSRGDPIRPVKPRFEFTFVLRLNAQAVRESNPARVEPDGACAALWSPPRCLSGNTGLTTDPSGIFSSRLIL